MEQVGSESGRRGLHLLEQEGHGRGERKKLVPPPVPARGPPSELLNHAPRRFASKERPQWACEVVIRSVSRGSLVDALDPRRQRLANRCEADGPPAEASGVADQAAHLEVCDQEPVDICVEAKRTVTVMAVENGGYAVARKSGHRDLEDAGREERGGSAEDGRLAFWVPAVGTTLKHSQGRADGVRGRACVVGLIRIGKVWKGDGDQPGWVPFVASRDGDCAC